MFYRFDFSADGKYVAFLWVKHLFPLLLPYWGILISKETYIVCKWFSEGGGVLDLSATNINARKAYRPCLADSSAIFKFLLRKPIL
jgi:hypothetical protein